MSDVQDIKDKSDRASTSGQGISAGLGVALGASMVGLATAPAALAGLAAGALFLGAKRIADDQKKSAQGDH